MGLRKKVQKVPEANRRVFSCIKSRIEWLLRWSQCRFVPRGKKAIAEEGRGPRSGPTAGVLIGQHDENRGFQSMTYDAEGATYDLGVRLKRDPQHKSSA